MAQIKWDTSQWRNGLKIAKDKMAAAGLQAVGKAGLQLMNDCLMESPTIPLKSGLLRSSGSVFAQQKRIATSPRAGGAGGNPAQDHGEGLDPEGVFVSRVGWNTAYAAKTHEKPMQFTEPSAGNKWMESKMASHAQDYIRLAAEHFRKAMGL
ncbi:MAG: hypothetical protein WC683_04580 [bacterium]